MLVDIYAEPIIAELCNTYPIDKPVISIPRVRVKSTTTSYDGSSSESHYIPTYRAQVRTNIEDVNVSPNASVNVIGAVGADQKFMRMNRRFTLLTKVVITEDDGTTTTTREVEVSFRPDNRNQLVGEFTFVDGGGETVIGQLSGHINYEKCTINFQVLYEGGTAGYSFTTDHGVFSVRLTPVGTMNGRTSVDIETESNDVTIDPNEDFIINVTEEDMQDYKSIYKIDLIRTLSEAIKRQILLNKDFELAYFLKAAENEMGQFGARLNLNLDNYAYSAGDYMPSTPVDVLKAIIPNISSLSSQIRRNYHMYPSYIVTGLKTASMLRSLQDMAVSLPNLRGEIGFNGETAQFMKLKILESEAIEDSKMYLSTKAPNNALEKSSIIDLIYQPMYVVKEITDGMTRHFVRSRTMIEIARADGLGVINVENISKYVGNVG